MLLATKRFPRVLGWFSVGLGLLEVVGSEQVAGALGLNHRRRTIRAYGLREFAVGIGLLAAKRKTIWCWARVVGDVFDLVLLAPAFHPANRLRRRVGAAAAGVAAVTVADILAAV